MKSCKELALVLGALAGGCRTIETKRPIFHSQPILTASPKRIFEVHHEGGARGYVVLFQASAADNTDSVYVVRNSHHQDLGVIDALGRAYRYRPHQQAPVWLGSGSIPRGIQRILETESLPVMHEIPFPETPTSPATRDKRVAVTESQTF